MRRKDTRLQATFINEISGEEKLMMVDQIVVEQGTIPDNDLYSELRLESANDGVTNLEALVQIKMQPLQRKIGFELHRIGDAVTSRNIQAAMLDAVRLCSAL